MRRLLLGFTVAAVVLEGGSADAYVREHANDTGAPLFWQGPLVLTPDVQGCVEIGAERTQQQIEQAAQSWMDAVAHCSDLEIRIEPAQPSPGRAIDGINTLVWLEDEWGTVIDGQFVPYGDGVVALTTLTYHDRDGSSENGRIVDSDTELNGVERVFGTAGETAVGALDVQAVVAHEIGHALGLAHSCWDPLVPVQPDDDRGEPVPECFAELPADIVDTTMYPFSMPDDIRQRSPEADDVAGVCAIYPSRADGGDESACEIGSAQRRAPSFFAVLAVGVLLARRRGTKGSV